MEVYEARYDYKKERDDLLSFTKGEKFYITDKTNDKWWKAKKLDDHTYGYVPSTYLKLSAERVIGRIIPEGRRDTEEHKIHLRALAEIHKKVKPLPAHVIGQAIGVELIDSSDEEDQPGKRFPPKKIQIPKTALRLEGLARDKPLPLAQHKRSHTHRGGLSVADTPSPTSPPPLPTPPMSPNQAPPYKKHSWPQGPHAGEPLTTATHHQHHLHPYYSVRLPSITGVRLPIESKQDEEDELPDYLKTLPPPPMVNPPPPDYDLEDGASDRNDMPFHHKLNSSGRYPSSSSEEANDLSPTYQGVDESLLIKPKPLPNPVKESREHREMHRELRASYKTGGPLPQRAELDVVNRERSLRQRREKMDAETKSRRTSMEIKLQERKDKERMEEEKEQRLAKMREQEAIEEERKPEFMKVNLKKTNSLPTT
ncbi:WAS/WASL-interacting protein family member 2-like isoform X2 [Patiria miniata]|uniref:SH3 domain-containing protein n=1 Tax=Patiria miniata TaxID=46514 RepID=A0A913ZE73_PATMI|nr:WAS/WASL-interacting protein family member 2-like isoform X2 [Patiria miniata]